MKGTRTMLVLSAVALLAGAMITWRVEARDEPEETGVLGNLGAPENAAENPVAASPKGKESAAESPLTEPLSKFDWLNDPELDQLRMEVYRAELKARHLKALAEIREYERKLGAKPSKEAEASKPAPVPVKPKPRLRLVAIDGQGAVVEVDGKICSFDKVGAREGDVTLRKVLPDRVTVEVGGEEFEARF